MGKNWLSVIEYKFETLTNSFPPIFIKLVYIFMSRPKGYKHTEETKKKISEANTGGPIKKTSFKIGHIPWNKSRVGIYSKETLEKIRINRWKNITTEDRFFQKIEKTESCWIWKGAKGRGKYGRYGIFWINKKNDAAHRASYIIHYGKIPKDMLVLHKCDNPPCVNPDHLFLGTHKENMKDAMNKGRFSKICTVFSLY